MSKKKTYKKCILEIMWEDELRVQKELTITTPKVYYIIS